MFQIDSQREARREENLQSNGEKNTPARATWRKRQKTVPVKRMLSLNFDSVGGWLLSYREGGLNRKMQVRGNRLGGLPWNFHEKSQKGFFGNFRFPGGKGRVKTNPSWDKTGRIDFQIKTTDCLPIFETLASLQKNARGQSKVNGKRVKVL